MESVASFSKRFLVVEGAKCYRHCERPTRFVQLFEEDAKLLGAYVCPDDYVSRVVAFSLAPEISWFESFLRNQVGDRLRSKDIRWATRHGWELGREAERNVGKLTDPNRGLTETYWTFYAKDEKDKKSGSFLCSSKHGGCGTRLFTKRLDEDVKLCENCRSRQG